MDKREFQRLGRRFVMRVALNDGNPWPRWSLVTTHNLSAGGASFTFDQSAKEGDSLVCMLHFVDRVIECKAKVIRLEEGTQKPLLRIAVTFEGVSKENQEFIEDYTRSLGGLIE
jgi:hypothetical protein